MNLSHISVQAGMRNATDRCDGSRAAAASAAGAVPPMRRARCGPTREHNHRELGLPGLVLQHMRLRLANLRAGTGARRTTTCRNRPAAERSRRSASESVMSRARRSCEAFGTRGYSSFRFDVASATSFRADDVRTGIGSAPRIRVRRPGRAAWAGTTAQRQVRDLARPPCLLARPGIVVGRLPTDSVIPARRRSAQNNTALAAMPNRKLL